MDGSYSASLEDEFVDVVVVFPEFQFESRWWPTVVVPKPRPTLKAGLFIWRSQRATNNGVL